MLNPATLNKNLSFKRALSSQERVLNHQVCNQALKLNELKVNAMVMPAVANPAYKDDKGQTINTGLGSPYSKGTKANLLFSRDLFAVNAIQELPLGFLDGSTKSPYSGSSFSIGDHLVDPGNLKQLGLVTKIDIEKVNDPKNYNYWNNYDNYFEPKYQEFLTTAYNNFKKLEPENKLKKEFKEFKEKPHIKVWLKPNARVAEMAKEHGTWDFQSWPDIDKKLHIYLKQPDSPKYNEALKRAEELDKKSEEYQFVQFIAYKQRDDMHKFANKNGIKIMADSNIGWDSRDVLSNPQAFLTNLDGKKPEKPGKSTLGCPMPYSPDNYDMHSQDKSFSVSNWGIYALNPDVQESVDYLKARSENIAKYSDGIRIDAAWQYVTPFIINNYENKKDFEWKEVGSKYIDALAGIFKENKIEPDMVIAENIGSDENGRISKTNKIIEKHGYPIIEKVFEGAYDVANVNSKNWLTLGVHDDETLLKQTKFDREKQVDYFSRVFSGKTPGKKDKGSVKIQTNFIDLYGGREERYNNCNDWKNPNLWSLRLPLDFERFYYENIAEKDEKGNKKDPMGLNMPEALIKSFKQKGWLDSENTSEKAQQAKKLLPFLQYFDKTLKTREPDSPMTTQEADSRQEIIEEIKKLPPLEDKSGNSIR